MNDSQPDISVQEPKRDLGMPDDTKKWPDNIYAALKRNEVRQVCYVPDGGHARLINHCLDDAEIICTALTTEEEGGGVIAGAWLGGDKSVLLMQSSGVGNCVNLFSLLAACTFPSVIVVTMRGQYGEYVPWQIPMGQATQGCFELMGFPVLNMEEPQSAGDTMQAAFQMAYGGGKSVAVLISQRMIGAKTFSK